MKFGSQIHDRSVPEWRLNNIDYKYLKGAVKKATTFHPDKEPAASLAEDRELQGLYSAFQTQCRSVNAFTSLKIKETSTRLVSVESSILRLQQRGDLPAQKRKRQLALIGSHLDHCNSELLRICRFLILQKIALRKLLKKFLKYYPYGKQTAEQFVEQLKSSPELTEGEDGISFVKVDLDPYLLEVSLVVDVLQELEQGEDGTSKGLAREGVSGDAPGTIRGVDFSSKSIPTDTDLSFDSAFLGKATRLQSFLVSGEDVSQVKFLLLQMGFHVVDDDMLIASQKSVKNSSSANLNNLASNQGPRAVKSFHDLQVALDQHQNSTSPKISDIKSSQNIDITLLDSDSMPLILRSEAANQHPTMIVTGFKAGKCIIMCHVGGLRNHIVSDNVPVGTLANALPGKDLEDTSSSDADSTALTSIRNACLEWIRSHEMKPVGPLISTKRTRFTKNVEKGESQSYMICIDEDITLDRKQKVPHAFVEIRRLPSGPDTSQSKDQDEDIVTDLIEKLLESKSSSFPLRKDQTLWKLLYLVHNAQDLGVALIEIVNPSLNLSTNETLFEAGSKELSDVAAAKRRKSGTISSQRKRDVLKKGKSSSPDSQPKQRIRYWNEFDDGDEAYDGYQSFDSNDEESQNRGPMDNGFIVFNKNFINTMYSFSERFKDLISFSRRSPERRPLLADSLRGPSLNSVTTSSTSYTGVSAERDYDRYLDYTNQQMDSESLYETRHDLVITFFYLSSLLISCITSGISLGIVASIFRELNDDILLGPGPGLVTIIIVTLLMSLLLSCTSLLLLFSRFQMAPWWHYVGCFLIFLVVACTVCYGLIEIFL
ncbi:LAQU0S06e01046g1_1 [Lachancea quebecensis]|uniref:LAQU0S06e01046g1_1 n=1 Tax=Lachancea quebecensis TaxID=1654605 RepID=A0A0P1KR45_9SACH|nr:LAQU0S06e01046g1_1 [Lachancea quebecensis]